MDSAADQPLWAITSYYNPSGYQRRRDNYQRFRADLKVPLVTVELAFDGKFELGPGDADVLIQLRGGDVMWQKERLLNIALASVPPTCPNIAWIDCDVLFDNPHWPQQALVELQRQPMVQLFASRADVSPDGTIPAAGDSYSSLGRQSAAAGFREGSFTAAELTQLASCYVTYSIGLAWAARREVLDGLGFYDACVLGGGDAVLMAAAIVEPHQLQISKMNASQLEHFLRWHKQFYQRVQGNVSYIDGRLLHLWHGDLERRQYCERHDILEQHQFDPESDLSLDVNQVWRWNSSKPEFHQSVRQYFDVRCEDG